MSILRLPEGPGYHRRRLWSLRAFFFSIHFWALKKQRAHYAKLEDLGECDTSPCNALRSQKPYCLLKTVALTFIW